MLLNVNKTNVINFALGSRQIYSNMLEQMLQDESLDKVSHCKFLGVTLDSKLNWNAHISELAGKLSSATFAIRKIVEWCGVEAAKAVYSVYFHSLCL